MIVLSKYTWFVATGSAETAIERKKAENMMAERARDSVFVRKTINWWLELGVC